jgi:hypothetical protein
VNKRQYIKPKVDKIDLDYTISIQMTTPPHPPDDDFGSTSKKDTKSPFASPFGDKPFG